MRPADFVGEFVPFTMPLLGKATAQFDELSSIVAIASMRIHLEHALIL